MSVATTLRPAPPVSTDGTRDRLFGKRVIIALSLGNSHVNQMRTALGVSKDDDRVSNALNYLVNNGDAERTGPSLYRITAQGIRVARKYAKDARLVSVERHSGEKETVATVRRETFPYRSPSGRILIELAKIDRPVGSAEMAGRLGRGRQATWESMNLLVGCGRLQVVPGNRYTLTDRGRAEAAYWERRLGPQEQPDKVTSFEPEPAEDSEGSAADGSIDYDALAEAMQMKRGGRHMSQVALEIGNPARFSRYSPPPAQEQTAKDDTPEQAAEEITEPFRPGWQLEEEERAQRLAAPIREVNWEREFVAIAHKMADALAIRSNN